MRYLAIGVGALLAVLFITFFALMASRADGLPAGHGDCTGGVVSIEGIDKDEDEVTYNAGTDIIDGVCLKAGNTQRHNQVYRNDGVILSSDGKQKCYVISGIGTSKVTVTREGEGRECQGISHIDVTLRSPTPTPTATLIASPTPSPVLTPPPSVTPTATSGLESPTTPIPTATSQVSPTPILGMPSAFPNTGGGGAGGGEDAFCRDWTTGQAGDSSTPCPAGDNLAGTLKTVSILLVFIGLATLAFWALFRRG